MKRGISHLEVIIGFGIFLSVVLFISIFFSQKFQEDKSLEKKVILLKNNFIEKTKTEIKVFFLNASEPCSPYNNLKGTSKQISQNQYYIALSQEINNTLKNCSSVGDFEIGSIRRKEVLSNNSLENIKTKYYNDYENLKKGLSIEKNYNFEIYSEGYELKKNSTENLNIVSRKYRLEVINSNGVIEKKEFTFRIW
ncbi:MAG: hypothetical protein QW103_01995 [Candidatus Pacearchaeota archaeon]